MTTKARLGAQQRAALEEERDFLVRSLDDLEAELAAGDVSPDDHRVLRDDYTVRLARTLRRLDDDADRSAPGPGTPGTLEAGPSGAGRRRALTLLAIAIFGAVAAVTVAQAAGSRNPGGSLTGDIRGTVRQRLATCANESAPDRLVETMQCYDAILEDEPSNAEALSYKGWMLVLSGEPELVDRGTESINAAIEADPTYPDARAFAAVAALRTNNPDVGLAHLDALDTLNPPPDITDLLTQFQLRQRLEAG